MIQLLGQRISIDKWLENLVRNVCVVDKTSYRPLKRGAAFQVNYLHFDWVKILVLFALIYRD